MAKIIINGTEVNIGGESLPSGGTTDQVLTKTSDADGNAEWKDPVAGTYSTEETRIGTR